MNCRYCKRKMESQEPDKSRFFWCDKCNTMYYLEDDGQLVDALHRGRGSNNRTCENCGRSMKGATYYAPWENGNNRDGYVKCPHCGHANFDWDDD